MAKTITITPSPLTEDESSLEEFGKYSDDLRAQTDELDGQEIRDLLIACFGSYGKLLDKHPVEVACMFAAQGMDAAVRVYGVQVFGPGEMDD